MFANFGMKHLVIWMSPLLGKNTPTIATKWFTYVLLLLLAWTLGRLVWFWVIPPANSIPLSSSDQWSVGHVVPSHQIEQIINQHFFGRFSKEATLGETKFKPIIDAPQTRLHFTLVGVVTSSEPEHGLAVIANRSVQKIYGIGETIEETNIILHQVQSNHVILRNNGRDETLMLNGLDYNPAEQTNPATHRKEAVSVKQNTGQPDLSNVKAEIMNDPQALLKYITWSQERNQYGLIGYRIDPGNDSRLFQEAGLQSGDIAVNLNGADLTNPAEMNRIWLSLSHVSEISLTVKREGQLHDIYISLE
ncbi:type II secretion system protein GspC [Candidatus Enterovibrio altilux]|uniref:General secretion pathway protein C n=1 Tax=Candidatus Enterovibrio altilux TaxID=1927128 RepID=A0A291B8X5_9GAMM|nr:type II secretion system protein GspC [Candidatus Enterovibrio luxaltus]ATF09476.1 General secretion pathway protein C [Candidatus Enterovibrio luxaltus]